MFYKPLFNPVTERWDAACELPGKVGTYATIGDSFTEAGALALCNAENGVPPPLPVWVPPAERKFARMVQTSLL